MEKIKSVINDEFYEEFVFYLKVRIFIFKLEFLYGVFYKNFFERNWDFLNVVKLKNFLGLMCNFISFVWCVERILNIEFGLK